MDDLIRIYASKAQEVYDNQTAGDWTFLGLMAEFARKVQHQSIVDTED